MFMFASSSNFNAFFLSFSGTKELIRKKNLKGYPNQRALLAWDSFRELLTNVVKDQLLARPNIDVAVVPGGLIAVLQPLNKCINKLFTTKVLSEYQASMVKGPFTYMPPRKKQSLMKEQVSQWVDKACQEIPATLIVNSFKSCGNLMPLTAPKMKQYGKKMKGKAATALNKQD